MQMAPFRRSARLQQKRKRQRSASPEVNASQLVPAGEFRRLVHTPRADTGRRKRAPHVRHRSASPKIETCGWNIRKDFVGQDGRSLDDFLELRDGGGYETPHFKHRRYEEQKR